MWSEVSVMGVAEGCLGTEGVVGSVGGGCGLCLEG